MGSAPNANRPLKANPGGMEMMNTSRPQNPSMGYKPPTPAARPQNPSMGYMPRKNTPVTNTPPRAGGLDKRVSSPSNLDTRTRSPRPSQNTPYQAPGMGYIVNKPKPMSGRSPGVGSTPVTPKQAPRMKAMPVSKPKPKIPDYLNPALRKKKVVKKPIR
jgi:hypothetical protein